MGTKRPTVVVLSFLSSTGDSAYYLPGIYVLGWADE